MKDKKCGHYLVGVALARAALLAPEPVVHLGSCQEQEVSTADLGLRWSQVSLRPQEAGVASLEVLDLWPEVKFNSDVKLVNVI